jgi:predicted helicase
MGFQKILDKYRKIAFSEPDKGHRFIRLKMQAYLNNQRTSGEFSRKEGGKIFGSGSYTPSAITLWVKKGKRG